jgi:hypothetical protein
MARLTRRRFLVAGAGVVAVAAGLAAAKDPIRDLLRDEPPRELPSKGEFPPPRRIRDCSAPANPVVAENCRPGAQGWRMTQVDGRIEGFFAHPSVGRGEEAAIRVRCADPRFRIEIYRSGYYDGARGRLVERTAEFASRTQPEPHTHAPTGLVSASNWSVSHRFDTSGWPSGVYLAKLVSSGGSQGQAILVVREDDRRADALVFISDTTYQAYNYWGDYSLYAGDDGSPRAVRVSYDRPHINVRVNQADWYLRAELPLVSWLEAEGYDVTYAAASDAHRRPDDLGRRRAWLSGSHSEYASDEMRAAFERRRDEGVGLAFFGANSFYWRVRFEPDPWSGEPDRVMVCYKSIEESLTTLGPGPVEDPVSRTSLWRDPSGPNRPENALIGVMYAGQDLAGNHPFVVPADIGRDEPLWRHAGLGAGPTSIGAELIGWEWDGVADNGHTPAGLRRLSATPVEGDVMDTAGRITRGAAVASAATYTAASGAIVFAAGTILFSWGLDDFGFRLYSGGHPQGEPDLRIQQLTTNALTAMGCRPGSPAADLHVAGEPS